MVKCQETLPIRSDPSIAGGLQNYTLAARQYHDCANLNSDLIDWVNENIVK